MYIALQIVAGNLPAPDPVTSSLIQTVGWLVAGAALLLLLICAVAAVAQCCGEGRRPQVYSTLLALSAIPTGAAVASAQDARVREPPPQDPAVREIEPRLVRLWGRDSIRLSVNMCGVQCSNQVSLSPDGRWLLLQSYDPAGDDKLWLAPTAGGEMVELARGPSRGGEPQWFPSGNAVAFTSTDAGASDWFRVLMRLPISSEDGRPRGSTRQVSLEPVEPFAISPDGDAVAYIADRDPNARSGALLKVIPATGGNAISVRTPPKGIKMALRWGADGRDLYCLTWTDINSDELVLHRVPVDGGDTEILSEWDDWVHMSPRARYLVRELSPDQTEGHLYEAATLTGRPLIRFRLPGPFELAGFGNEPGELLAVRQDIVNPLRVIPVAGGPMRRLNEAWGYDVPLAWTRDGSEIFFRTTLDGERAFMLAPVDGGPMRHVPLPWNANRPRLSGDGGRVLYAVENPATPLGGDEGMLEAGLFLYEVENDRTLPVEMPTGPFELRLFFSIDGDAVMGVPGTTDPLFAFVITRRGRHEVWLVDGSGSSTLGWSLPEEDWTPGDNAFANIAMYGDRLAFAETAGGEGTLYVAMAGDDRATSLFTLPGSLGARGSNGVKWSPDGRLLTVSHRAEVLLVEVDEAGELVGEPGTLHVESGPDWLGGIQWMPDGEHFLALGGQATSGGQSDVWLVSLDPGRPAVNLTGDFDQPIWWYYLSPDGRYITFDSEIPRGSSVWQVDLGDILADPGR
jgi:Tol biopolymer transport system component